MKTTLKIFLLSIFIALILSSCAYFSPKPVSLFTPVNLNPKIASGEYQKKVDNFLLIFDDSSSMFQDYNWEMKSKQAKRVAIRMNQTIPDLDMQAGLRIFGPTNLASDSKLAYGMEKYSKTVYGNELAKIPLPAGGTPLSKAIRVAGTNLENTTGKIALIIISDAEDVGSSSVKAATGLKEQYGDRICIYTIHIGDNARGRTIMSKMANVSECGFTTDYAALETAQGMADFVEQVFLEKAIGPSDSDGDGVYDSADKCPGTPKGTKVDANGCPIPAKAIDSDGDGVLDPNDECPGTPHGIKVDQDGCPLPIKENVTIELRVEFDFDNDTVRPLYHQELKNFANFMAANPNLSVTLEGHTDNYGTESYNADLSNRRAKSVKRYLTSNFGLSANRIMTKGYGYLRPEASNKTDEGRQKNRRVYAVIRSN